MKAEKDKEKQRQRKEERGKEGQREKETKIGRSREVETQGERQVTKIERGRDTGTMIRKRGREKEAEIKRAINRDTKNKENGKTPKQTDMQRDLGERECEKEERRVIDTVTLTYKTLRLQNTIGRETPHRNRETCQIT